MNEIPASTYSKFTLRFKKVVLGGLAAIYSLIFLSDLILSLSKGLSILLLVFLGILFLLQALTLAGDLEVDGHVEPIFALTQAVGLAILGLWLSLHTFTYLEALGGDAVSGVLNEGGRIMLGIVFAVLVFILALVANRNMGRYLFCLTFTTFFTLSIPVFLAIGVADDHMNLGVFKFDMHFYSFVVGCWAIVPVSYLIAYYKQFRDYRKREAEADLQD
jgi:hypothetical protein